MKKIIFATIVTVYFNLLGFAQPVLNSTDFVEGVSSNGYYLDVPTFSPGGSGENQVWDFSELSPSGNGFTLTTVPYATSPFSSNYTEGNFSMKQDFSTIIIYDY